MVNDKSIREGPTQASVYLAYLASASTGAHFSMAAAATGATPATARKILFTTSSTLLSSSFARSRRGLSCSAAAIDAPRIAQQPPDLVRWVQREGGFVHPALRVANHQEHGLGVSAGAADGDIPPGELLIALPGRLPLRLRRPTGTADDVLVQLAKQVPGKAFSEHSREKDPIDVCWCCEF
jgi:hypothetical protein